MFWDFWNQFFLFPVFGAFIKILISYKSLFHEIQKQAVEVVLIPKQQSGISSGFFCERGLDSIYIPSL